MSFYPLTIALSPGVGIFWLDGGFDFRALCGQQSALVHGRQLSIFTVEKRREPDYDSHWFRDLKTTFCLSFLYLVMR